MLKKNISLEDDNNSLIKDEEFINEINEINNDLKTNINEKTLLKITSNKFLNKQYKLIAKT